MEKVRWDRGCWGPSLGWPGTIPVLVVLFMALLLPVEASSADQVFVQSVKAALLGQPQLGAVRVAEVEQGAALPVVKQQGAWYQVRYQDQQAWISRLLVADQPPGGKVSLLVSDEADLASGARRRASSFTTAAAARGLSEDRKRLDGGFWTADMSQVEKVEKLKVTQSEVLEFLKGVEQ
ncbi:hypothetical protein JCM30471_27110 [Desulfuromonas carbonis]|nr:hypothetical protein DBW_0503 [Desulfuromonas sp. DDH964]